MALLWRKRRRRNVRGAGERSTLRHMLVGLGVFILIALLLYSVWYVTRLPTFTIAEISVEGGETVSHEEIRSLVERELTGSYFLLVPYRFTYLYPKEKILHELQGVARVHSVSIDRSDTHLTVTFDEYIPYALLCESGFETAQCYFLDKSGYAFSPAPPLRGGAFIRHVIEGEVPESGMKAFEPETLSAVEGFVEALESEFEYRVRLISHEETGDVTYHLNEGGRLFVSGDMSLQEVFENLQSVLASAEFEHLLPGNFNYIDLRFGNKIYVNEELEVVATTSEATTDEDPSFTIE